MIDHQILSVLSDLFRLIQQPSAGFKFYLTDWTQVFTHAGSQTLSFSVDYSIPHGSVFSPLCFVSYTEDVGRVGDLLFY